MAFIDEWKKFLDNLQTLGKRSLNDKGLNDARTGLGNLFDDVIDRLKKQDVTDELQQAVSIAATTKNEDVIPEYLENELKYFNTLAQGPPAPLGDGVDNALEAGGTVKDSIEELFDLPKWLEKVLKVLNELLSLIRGS
jgi:hypothetical protein